MFTTNSTSLSLAPSASNLQRLNIIRIILLTGIAVALSYVYWQVSADISHYFSHSVIAALYAFIALFTALRLRQPWPVTDAEYFLHLLTDVSIISALLYFSGGASNPFVSYFLVPLCISAAILPWRYTWVIAGLSLAAYSLMFFYYQPFPTTELAQQHHDSSNSFNQHVLGMWFNFALSASLITYFVVKMANSLRQKESLLATDREDTLRDEQILAVATLAAGTAHELGTPLSTMTVLLDEMLEEHRNTPSSEQLNQDIELLQQQVNSCRHILKSLVHTAETHSLKQKEHTKLTHYIEQLLSHWQVLRPAAQFNYAVDAANPQTTSPNIEVDSPLEQALMNVLNNAADANPKNIAINLGWTSHHYTLRIHDQGPGIPLEIAEQLGKPFITTKGKGLGLGLFLSHATVQRYGGTIELHNHPDGGTVADIVIPLNHNEDLS